DAARAAPQLRDAFARRRRRPARDPGAARPRIALDHAALHRGRCRAAAARLRQGASPRPWLMPARAKESREIAHARDGRAEVTGHAAAAIAARLRAARWYARVPELPFTTRSLTRSEHLARGRRFVLWVTVGYAALIALVALALLNEGETTWTVGLVVIGGLLL